MISKKIEIAIVKYLTQSADIDDLDLLNNWIVLEENQIAFKTYVKTNFVINLAMNDPDLENIKKNLLKEIRYEKKKDRLSYLTYFKYAAIAIIFLGLGFMWRPNVFKATKLFIPNQNAITLELDDGTFEIIYENGTKNILNSKGDIVGVQQGKKMVYSKTKSQSQSQSLLTYNTINVPNGKRFELMLADGTTVHLNSGSSLKYPISFSDDLNRQVYLLGEGYFDVTKSKDHLFIVNSEELDVQVYGTKFNISNYPEDNETEVVLVEGSVSMAKTGKNGLISNEHFLRPGYKGSFNKGNKKIVDSKVNTALYTSWMNGNLVFRNTPFNIIIQKLERHYEVKIINENSELGNEKFNATIEVNNESIEEVFNYFKKVYQIEFEIRDEIVLIH